MAKNPDSNNKAKGNHGQYVCGDFNCKRGGKCNGIHEVKKPASRSGRYASRPMTINGKESILKSDEFVSYGKTKVLKTPLEKDKAYQRSQAAVHEGAKVGRKNDWGVPDQFIDKVQVVYSRMILRSTPDMRKERAMEAISEFEKGNINRGESLMKQVLPLFDLGYSEGMDEEKVADDLLTLTKIDLKSDKEPLFEMDYSLRQMVVKFKECLLAHREGV